jgi:hypothetical protein
VKFAPSVLLGVEKDKDSQLYINPKSCSLEGVLAQAKK